MRSERGQEQFNSHCGAILDRLFQNSYNAEMVGRPKEFDPDVALNAALDAFWSKGFEGCSMAELLDDMAINRQSLYDTFGDKRELFLAVLQEYMNRVGTRISNRLFLLGRPRWGKFATF